MNKNISTELVVSDPQEREIAGLRAELEWERQDKAMWRALALFLVTVIFVELLSWQIGSYYGPITLYFDLITEFTPISATN